VVVGCGSYAEIWAEENYNKAVDDEDQEAIKLALEEAGL
jgi:DNA-binding transcriptional regulator/RsmH inhibitor MraZ